MGAGRLGAQIVAMTALVALWSAAARATPPQYPSFGRDQRIVYEPRAEELLRIWVVYVGQGDGILIQLPARYGYDPDPRDADPARSERIDIAIDGGSASSRDADRFVSFVESLYGGRDPIRIEHAVITHHDQDHVRGLMELLKSPVIAVDSIYHNGLASWRAGVRGFPARGRPAARSIYSFNTSHGQITRALARVEDDGVGLSAEHLIGDRRELLGAHRASELQGVYALLAAAVLDKTSPEPVRRFDRAFAGAPFVAEVEAASGRGAGLGAVELDLIWPLRRLAQYGGSWGETINGNSLTFRLAYGDFAMLFTGDHNDKSEAALLAHLERIGQTARLDCDVLKVPHHGSGHALERFFRHPALGAVLSVASLGPEGARSKRAYGQGAWQHPSTEVIGWLGGAHRVYTTQLHERRFDWPSLATAADHEALYEPSHVLIETDGRWFRIVEIDDAGVGRPPPVTAIRRGDGTRWIRAKEG